MYILNFVNRSLRTVSTQIAIALIVVFVFYPHVSAQQLDRIQKEEARGMLSNIKKNIEKNYYDSNFHGLNLEERFAAADEKLKQAATLGSAFGIIAQALLDLNDSHTFFVPPQRSAKVEYGWQITIIGDKPYISAVKPKSDAEKKGLKTGDLVLSVNGFRPTRNELWKMLYYYYQISPQSAIKLVVQSPGSDQPRELSVSANVVPLRRVVDINADVDLNELIRDAEDESHRQYHRFENVGGVVVWKMPSFSFDPQQVDAIVQQRLQGSRGLVLDLRGNLGGYVKTLERLASYFFESETKIADIKRRNSSDVSKTNPQGKNTFKGQIVVLIDSRSASAAETFARLMQIEKRGLVIGDRSSGAVMEARSYPMQMGGDRIIMYGLSLTDADVIMTDGKSLEHVGVDPDEMVLPTGEDLAASSDPALARALEKVGVKITPADAGKLFPIEWQDN